MENYRGPFNILLVEDNPADIELTREALGQCRAKINLHVVSNGMEAYQYLQDVAPALPDLVLMDLNLPVWDGKSLLKKIKSDSQLRSVPIVVMSTSSNHNDVMESYHLQANCYIVKPLDVDQFFEKIRYIENFWFNTVLLPR